MTKTKEKLENFLSELNNEIKISERINKGLKKLNLEEIPTIKALSYISKINNTKKGMNKLLSNSIKNIAFNYEEKSNDIKFDEYTFHIFCSPKDIKIDNILEDSLNISWYIDKLEYKDCNLNNMKYRVEGRKNKENFKKLYEGNDTKCNINNLMPDTNYQFRICCIYNDKIFGEWSNPENIKTLKSILSNNITITEHNDYINCLIILKDGRLASCSNDKSVKIYNKNNKIVEININENSQISYIFEVEDNVLMTCLRDGVTNVYKFLSDKQYQKIQSIEIDGKNTIKKIIKLINGNFISISNSLYLKIWNYLNQKYNLFKSISSNNSYRFEDIIEVKNDEIVAQINSTEYLSFIDIKNEKEIYRLNVSNIRGNHIYELQMLNKNVLFYGLDMNIFLIDINSHNIIKRIDNLNFQIYCSNVLSENMVVLGVQNGNLIILKISNNYNQINTSKIIAHGDCVKCIIKGENGKLISASNDKLIKIWDYIL